MDRPASFPSALTRLESALDRLEAMAKNVNAADVAQGTGEQADNATIATLEAERDLLRLRHRRLVQSTERAIADLDTLIASRS